MPRILASRGALARALIGAVAVALLLAFTWKLSHPHAAGADVTQTTAVSAGPDSVSQPAAAGNPSQYDSPLERCHTAPNYPLNGANPILSEPLTTKFTSNVPLSVSVTYNGNQWYGQRDLVFTNRSSAPFAVDCAVIIFRAPSNSDSHYYLNSQPTGHPQADYLEVPRGDGTSFYIVRLGFHDVPLAQRTAYPGQTFTWQMGGAPGPITLEQTRDSIRFYGDLDLAGDTALVQRYGTDRLSN